MTVHTFYVLAWGGLSLVLLAGILVDFYRRNFEATPLWWFYGICAVILAMAAPR